MTATALVNQQTATSQAMGDALQTQTQVVLLTQIATLQGALAVTVSAKQTSIAVMDSLPGHLVFAASRAGSPVGSKVLSVSRTNSITPDNQHIAYRTNQFDGDLILANLDGSAQQKVLSGKHQGQVSWAPDTKHFTIVEDPHTANTITLAVGGLDSSEPKVVTPSGMEVQQVAWSPDNQHLMFVALTIDAKGNKTSGIYAVAPDGIGSLQTIVPPGKGSLSSLYWFPDMQHILYCEALQQGAKIIREAYISYRWTLATSRRS